MSPQRSEQDALRAMAEEVRETAGRWAEALHEPEAKAALGDAVGPTLAWYRTHHPKAAELALASLVYQLAAVAQASPGGTARTAGEALVQRLLEQGPLSADALAGGDPLWAAAWPRVDWTPAEHAEILALVRAQVSADGRLEALGRWLTRLRDGLVQLTQPLAGHAVAPVALDPGPARPGSRAALRLTVPPGQEQHHPVLFRVVAGRSEVLYPVSPDDWAPIGEFRQDGGQTVVDLVLRGPPGVQTFVLTLVPPGAHVDWAEAADTRWQATEDQLRAGALSALVVTVQVASG